MSQQLYSLSLDAIKYICNLINQTVDLPSTILDDLHIATNTTYSSYKLDALLKALKEENIEYCDAAIAGLNKLSKEIITDKSQITNENTIYLLLTDASKNIYEQWLLINGTPTMIGTTEMKLDNVYTKQEADARYTLLTDFDSLKTKVDGKVDKTDIVDNLTSTDTNKPLSANQGMLLKSMVLIPGVVLPYAGSAIPDGFLLCDGHAVSRTQYQNLFDVIGTTYGSGDGSTTFNLPNLRNKFIEGAGTNAVGTEMSAGLPNITGNVGYLKSFDVSNYYEGINTKIGCFTNSRNILTEPQTTIGLPSDKTDNLGKTGLIDFNASRSNSIYGNSNTVQPPAVVMNYIIKY